MPQVKSDVETFARIKVLGTGGSGGNALEHMIASKVNGVEFIAINTDSQDLHKSSAKKKIHIGKNVTKGLGAGMNPEVGRRAAEETLEENIEISKRYLERMSKMGMTLEIELGVTGGEEEGVDKHERSTRHHLCGDCECARP